MTSPFGKAFQAELCLKTKMFISISFDVSTGTQYTFFICYVAAPRPISGIF